MLRATPFSRMPGRPALIVVAAAAVAFALATACSAPSGTSPDVGSTVEGTASAAPSATGTHVSVPDPSGVGTSPSAAPQITYRTAVDDGSAATPETSGIDPPAGTTSTAASTDAVTTPTDASASTAPSATASGGSTPAAPAATSITGLAPALSGSYGTPVTVGFKLTSKGGPIASANVTVSYLDETRTTAVDDKGRASVVLDDLPVGRSTVTVRFPGDGTHRPASATCTVTIGRSPTEIRSLTVAGTSLTVNQNVTVRVGADVTVGFDVYSGGRPVSGKAGTISYDSVEKPATLDAHGHASLTVSGLAAGRHEFTVRYAGDKTRDGAGAPFTVTVTDPNAAPTTGGDSGDADNPCPASARACVDLSANTTWLQSGGKIVYGPVPMLSGRPGYRTPTGTFQVYWKDKDHRSTIFNDAPMPNSVFFVGGVAFHEGSLSVTSHGCIHLSWAASQQYWDSLSVGDTVAVFGYAPY